jgi:chemotaxis protein histidine kinase CheA
MAEPKEEPGAGAATLRARAVTDDGKGEGWDLSAVRRAEQAMEQLSKNFPEWMREEVERLDAARRAFAAAAGDAHLRAALFRATHDLRGHAGTFGYPLASTIAEGLCALIEELDSCRVDPAALVDAHVDAIRAIQRDNIQGGSDRGALGVIAALSAARRVVLAPAEALESQPAPQAAES